jgi:SynChlorMet cassette radical SAM/SPASM protein ScmF
MTTVQNKKPREVERRIAPLLNQIYFYLTDGCNLACRHCWLAPKFDHDGTRHPTLQMELFETAIREAKVLGLNRVKLTGGEPLLHPEPRRFISVSMDGADAATHDWVRGVEGSFEKAQQAVRNLVAVDTPPQIIMSVMRCNADQLEAMVRLAERMGASSVKFNLLQPTGRGEIVHEGTDGLVVAEFIKLGRYVDTELSRSTKLRLVFDYPIAFRPLSQIASGNGNGVCGILGILGVMANGQYALCGIGKHLPELVFGVVGRDPLEKVWQENGVLNALREGLPRQLGGICRACLMKSRCLGSCIAQNYYRTGSLWASFWFCKQAEEAGLFPATRLGRQ